jgi:hypothetical protein
MRDEREDDGRVWAEVRTRILLPQSPPSSADGQRGAFGDATASRETWGWGERLYERRRGRRRVGSLSGSAITHVNGRDKCSPTCCEPRVGSSSSTLPSHRFHAHLPPATATRARERHGHATHHLPHGFLPISRSISHRQNPQLLLHDIDIGLARAPLQTTCPHFPGA